MVCLIILLSNTCIVAAVVIIFEIGLVIVLLLWKSSERRSCEASYASTCFNNIYADRSLFCWRVYWHQLSSIMAIEGTLIIPEGLPNTAIQFLKGFLGFFELHLHGEYLYGYAISKSKWN